MAAIALTATMVVTTTAPGFAQEAQPTGAAPLESASAEPIFVRNAVVQPLNALAVDPVPDQTEPETALESAVPARAASLAEMVRNTAHAEPEDAQLRCLANGIYFESNGESLAGQLAVAHVIINRAQSGRFASSYCGVLTQRGQFSFVRGGVVPQAPSNAGWRRAVAIARIAVAEGWNNPAPGALFFHATHVSPGWNRPRVARIDNHVFYR